MSQEKSQPKWSLHSHMWSSLWKVLQNILSEIFTEAKNLDTTISPHGFMWECTGTLLGEGAGSTSCPSFYTADSSMKISEQSLMQHVTRQSQSCYFQHANSVVTACYKKPLVGHEWKAMTKTLYEIDLIRFNDWNKKDFPWQIVTGQIQPSVTSSAVSLIEICAVKGQQPLLSINSEEK